MWGPRRTGPERARSLSVPRYDAGTQLPASYDARTDAHDASHGHSPHRARCGRVKGTRRDAKGVGEGPAGSPPDTWDRESQIRHGTEHLLFFPAMMVPPQPQPLMPTLDSRQLAVQQQNFINQQAMILVRTMAGRWGCLERAGMGAGPAWGRGLPRLALGLPLLFPRPSR